MLRAELTPQSSPHYLESEILLIINNLRTRLVLVDCNSRARQEGSAKSCLHLCYKHQKQLAVTSQYLLELLIAL